MRAAPEFMDAETKQFNELVAVFDACAENDKADVETIARWYERNGQTEHAKFLREYGMRTGRLSSEKKHNEHKN